MRIATNTYTDNFDNVVVNDTIYTDYNTIDIVSTYIGASDTDFLDSAIYCSIEIILDNMNEYNRYILDSVYGFLSGSSVDNLTIANNVVSFSDFSCITHTENILNRIRLILQVLDTNDINYDSIKGVKVC